MSEGNKVAQKEGVETNLENMGRGEVLSPPKKNAFIWIAKGPRYDISFLMLYRHCSMLMLFMIFGCCGAGNCCAQVGVVNERVDDTVHDSTTPCPFKPGESKPAPGYKKHAAVTVQHQERNVMAGA